MNYKCLGCGITLQNIDKKKLGYVANIDGKYCERCFRIKNYNEYQKVDKNFTNFYPIIDKINLTGDLVVLVVDIMNIGNELKNLVTKLKNKPLIVLSKRDIFSYKINNQKFFDMIPFSGLDIISVSSNKNYNMDLLMEKINKYKNSKNVYIVGLTNSGKSTLINKIIYNYTDLNLNITTSMLPSTTLDTIEILINNNLCLIDTPGIMDYGNISNYLDNKLLKKILIKNEIKPKTYQIKCLQYILVEDFLKIECLEKCNMTLYFSNSLKIVRLYKDTDDTKLVKKEINATKNCDIVINGLGFISINDVVKLNIYTYENVEVYIRNK